MIGEQFGSWTVLEWSHTTPAPAYKKYYRCVCSCGEEAIVQRQSLKNGTSTRCRACRYEDLSGERNPNWSGFKDISGTFFGDIKEGAKKRGIEFNLRIQDIQEVWDLQAGICALTGWELEIGKDASIDRINSDIGYQSDNIQFVHKDVNWMKNAFSQEYFVKVCKAVAKHDI
jgi:hypothetical protein